MSTTPQAAYGTLGTGGTTIYTAFIAGGATRSEFVYLNYCNTTTSDITVDTIFLTTSGSTFITDDLTVPAKGNADWHGMITLNTSGQNIHCVPSAAGVDFAGTFVENA